MSLVFSIFSQDILPIFVIAGIGFLMARRFGANVKTMSTVAFNALSPCLVFYQLVTTKVSAAQSWRVVLFCTLLTVAIGVTARLAALPLRLDRATLSSFLLVVMFSNSGNYALPVVLFAFGRDSLAFASVYFVTSAILVYTFGVFVAASGRGSIGSAALGITRCAAASPARQQNTVGVLKKAAGVEALFATNAGTDDSPFRHRIHSIRFPVTFAPF